jgi:2-polyprenyl-3-methyl-5-hydroxy-6-metoxy-1,4-benzoquinol methylase
VSGDTPAGGVLEKASPGLHDAAFAALQRLAPAPARVLDLGAGAGAWAARLQSCGYSVTAVDRDRTAWALASLPLVELDLSECFATRLNGHFDIVTALEVIEHLENPSQFLRECGQLVGRDGLILLTTPNIENVAGRLRFLLTGQIRGFDRDPSYNDPTHITPLQTFLFERLCARARLEKVWQTTCAHSRATHGLAKRLVLRTLRPLLTGTVGGENHIYALRKAGA